MPHAQHAETDSTQAFDRADAAGKEWLTTAATALLVFAGSTFGAWLGVWLTFPVIGAAAVFLPYAVLCTALVVSRPRHWWIYLLASSLGNFFPHRGGGDEIGFVLSTELANYARALCAAVGMQALRFTPRRLNDLRGMSTFLVFAAGLGPAVGASLGALVVTRHCNCSSYGLTWAEWFLSNVVTALTLLPVTLTAVRRFQRRQRAWDLARPVEAAVIVVGLVAAGWFGFALSPPDMSTLPLRLYWPLPFLLWGAVRFTPVFTSVSLLLVAVLTVWGAIHGSGPFSAVASTHNLLSVQLFLVALSVPLLLLSALMQQARRTSDELRDSRAQYRSIVEDQTEMICRFRPNGTYTFVNAAYAAFHGLPAAAFVGRSMRELLPRAAELATEERIKAITPDSSLVTQDVEAIDSAGERRWLQWRDRGLFDASGQVLQYQSVGRDITDRWRAEQERRRLAAQTEIALTLREADRRKDEFLAMLGHELRNPLAPIGLALEVVRDQTPLDPELRRAHDVIARQLGHMTRLVDDLLDVSRITRGLIELRLETLDLRQVVAQGIETARPTIEARHHQIAVSVVQAPLWVRGDATRLAQMVGNLLHNAAKYTEPGGRIEVSVAEDGDSAVVSVRDNGIGIPAELLGHIFELFAQAPTRGNTARGGLGVGLTLVQRLAKLHGGSVEARSDGPNCGSDFRLRLPATGGPLAFAPCQISPRTDSDRRLRILVVDDNTDAAEALAALLERWGHGTRTVHDGAAALQVAEAFLPDVVLLDLDLPLIDGYEVARWLRRTSDPSRLLLVALTGFGQSEHRERTRLAGFDHHFVKPVDIPALRALLRSSAGASARNSC